MTETYKALSGICDTCTHVY